MNTDANLIKENTPKRGQHRQRAGSGASSMR